MPICFDLDGTLGSFSGGYLLLRKTLGELWGEEPSAEELHACYGSTDWEIVEELHRSRFGGHLDETHYDAYQDGCLRRFSAAFPVSPPSHLVFAGIVAALQQLEASGVPVAVVSGNAPKILDFKLELLGLRTGVRRIGSMPRRDRSALLAYSLEGCSGPHLYVGDRPHDLEASRRAGVPFLGVGDRVPEADVCVAPDAPREEVLAWIGRLAGT